MSIEIKIEIGIRFSSFINFIRSGCVLPQQKCTSMALFSEGGLELFEQASYFMVSLSLNHNNNNSNDNNNNIIYIYIYNIIIIITIIIIKTQRYHEIRGLFKKF